MLSAHTCVNETNTCVSFVSVCNDNHTGTRLLMCALNDRGQRFCLTNIENLFINLIYTQAHQSRLSKHQFTLVELFFFCLK